VGAADRSGALGIRTAGGLRRANAGALRDAGEPRGSLGACGTRATGWRNNATHGWINGYDGRTVIDENRAVLPAWYGLFSDIAAPV
jgi:hypothetical protein